MARSRSRVAGSRRSAAASRKTASDAPFLEPHETEVWRLYSEQVLKARFTPYPASQNELLLSYARDHAQSSLNSIFHLWAGENLRREARYDEAIAALQSLVDEFSGATFAGDAVAPSAFMQMASCYESLDDIDGAVGVYGTLAEKFSKDVPPSRCYYRIGYLEEQAGRSSDAAAAYKQAMRAGDALQRGLSLPDLARRALARLERGKTGFFVGAEEAAHALAGHLRRKDDRSLVALASPTHFTVAAGAHKRFFEASEILPDLVSELKNSTLRIEPNSVRARGPKAYLKTEGWSGKRFQGSVTFSITRSRQGWEWTGVGFDIPPPELFPAAAAAAASSNPLEIAIKAPWPAGDCFEAGGLAKYIDEQAAILALAVACATGRILACLAAAALTEALALGKCGFGPRGFYYGVSPTHVGREQFAIDFTRYKRGVPYLNIADGTPALAVAEGRVVSVQDMASTHDETLANFVTVRHIRRRFFVPPFGSPGPNFVDTPYVSEYFHLDGPGLIPVSQGMHVRQGTRLGVMDDTGCSALSHLHFSLHDDRVNNGDSVRPTPMDGQSLDDSDNGRCVCSSNEPFPA